MHTDLSTTEVDGKRKWIFPQYVAGIWRNRRRVVAILLMAWLFIAPWLSINHHQAIFFDIVGGKIHFLGFTFWVNELSAVLLFLLFIFSSILLLTVVLGRIFCGWACPITVFMEFVFRPIERFFEGEGAKQKKFSELSAGERILPSVLKYGIFLVIAVILGNTFVAYFMGSHRLFPMIQDGPSAHWGPFLLMIISSGIIFFQYGWFREQICLFVCPYGRLQSVLLDRDSLIVAYDKKRGEPRGHLGSTSGDCIDCKLCIRVCPTGIDIRNGLQLECIHCTACMDACDSIMQKVSRPAGLIRYQTESEVEQQKRRVLRPRLMIYTIVALISFSFLVGYVSTRSNHRVTLHRESRDLFSLEQNESIVVNPFRMNAINLSENPIEIVLKSSGIEDLTIEVPEGSIRLEPLEKRVFHVLLKIPKERFRGNFGLLESQITAISGERDQKLDVRLVGPIFK